MPMQKAVLKQDMGKLAYFTWGVYSEQRNPWPSVLVKMCVWEGGTACVYSKKLVELKKSTGIVSECVWAFYKSGPSSVSRAVVIIRAFIRSGQHFSCTVVISTVMLSIQNAILISHTAVGDKTKIHLDQTSGCLIEWHQCDVLFVSPLKARENLDSIRLHPLNIKSIFPVFIYPGEQTAPLFWSHCQIDMTLFLIALCLHHKKEE